MALTQFINGAQKTFQVPALSQNIGKNQRIKGALRVGAVIAASNLRGPSAAVTLPIAIQGIGLLR